MKRYKKGFTLIELSIVLLVIAFLTSSILAFISEQNKRKAVYDTEVILEKIDQALIAHLNQHGYLPCPAAREVALEDAAFGVATDCNAAVDPDVVEVTSDDDAEKVRIGDLPTRNLGIPDEYMFDGWNKRTSYAVVVDLAKDETTYEEYLTDQTNGVIQIMDSGGNQVSQAPSTCSINNATCPVVAYAIISHGRDGKGGYDRVGNLSNTACGASDDSSNCDDDYIFVDSFINDGEVVANYYDDIIRWKEKGLAQRQAKLLQTAQTGCTADSSFDITTISGLDIWYDATTSNYAYDPSPPDVWQWGAEGGRGDDLVGPSSSEYPTYENNANNLINGVQAVYFDGTDDSLTTTNSIFDIIGDGDHSMFIAAKVNTTKDSVFYHVSGAGTYQTLSFNTTGGDQHTYTRYDGSTTKTYSGGSAENNSSFIYSEIEDSNSIDTYIDGAAIISGADVSGSDLSASTLRLGSDTTDYFGGAMGEFIVFDSALSTEDRNNVVCYLGDKWGITVE